MNTRIILIVLVSTLILIVYICPENRRRKEVLCNNATHYSYYVLSTERQTPIFKSKLRGHNTFLKSLILTL